MLVSVSGLQRGIRLLPTDAFRTLVVTTSHPDDGERDLTETGVDP